jgi:hypothetical protein
VAAPDASRKRLRSVGLAVLAVALLAGCANVPGPQADSSSPPGPRPTLAAPAFRPPLLLGDIPRALAEPNIAVARDGTIVVTTPLYLWRSTDGATFEAVGEPECQADVALPACPPGFTGARPRGLVGLGDGDVAFAPDGTLWWAGLAAQDAQVPLQSSADRGTTWSAPLDVAEGRHSDREWLDVGPDGVVRVVWSEFEGSAPHTMYHRLAQGNLSAAVALPGADRVKGPLARAANGTLYVASSDQLGVWLAQSRDDGTTWRESRVADLTSVRGVFLGPTTWEFPVAAVDDAGTVYVTWAADDAAAGARPVRDLAAPVVHLAASTDAGATWTTTALSTPGHVAIYPWVVAGAAGRVAVAWYESASPLAGDALPSLWDVRLVESVSADAQAPQFLGGKANADPVHVGYVCTAGGGCGGRDRTRGDFFEVAIGPQGLPLVAWAGDSPTPLQHVQVWFGGVASGTPLR